MKKSFVALVVFFLVVGFAQLSHAAIINGGFETGDLSGWTINGSGAAVTSFSSYSPVSGNYFAEISTGLGANVYTTLSQSLSLSSGDVIEGYAAFLAGDYFNDNAYVKIIAPNATFTPWYSDVSIVGAYGSSGWQQWSWTAPASDQYTLEYGVANAGDNILNSNAMFDGAQEQENVVPEPASMTLLGLGLAGLARFRRRV